MSDRQPWQPMTVTHEGDLAQTLHVRSAAQRVLQVHDGGPRTYDTGDWDDAIDQLRQALQGVTVEPGRDVPPRAPSPPGCNSRDAHYPDGGAPQGMAG